MGKKTDEKTERTTVNLTPEAQAIKDRLTAEWDLRKLLSSAIILFDHQNYLVQKRLIIETMGGAPTSVAEIEARFRSQVLQIVRESKGASRTKPAYRKAKTAKSR